MTWPQGETRRVDTVRIEPGLQFYARILEADPCEGRGGRVDTHYIRLECIDAVWFHGLPNDFQGLVWSRSAADATACHVEMTVSQEELEELTSRLGGTARIEQQAWVKIWFDRRDSGGVGIPVTVYHPPQGNLNPASIAVFGRVNMDYMATRLERIRTTTQIYRKLLRFEEYISQ